MSGYVDVGLTGNDLPVFQLGEEMAALGGNRDNLSFYLEDFAGLDESFFKIAGDAGESGDHEVAEAVAGETVAFLEAVIEELSESFVVSAGESDESAANVTGREDAEFFTQDA